MIKACKGEGRGRCVGVLGRGGLGKVCVGVLGRVCVWVLGIG